MIGDVGVMRDGRRQGYYRELGLSAGRENTIKMQDLAQHMNRRASIVIEEAIAKLRVERPHACSGVN